eukprot:gene4168-4722_t
MASKEDRVIVVPIDGSDHSQRAFDWYVEHLHKKGDHVKLLNIVEPPKVPASFMVMGPLVTPDEWHLQMRQNVEKSKDIAGSYEKQCENAGIKCSVTIESSELGPGDKICETAKANDAVGVVMGSRGLNVLRRTFLGSVSSYVVNHSPCPVVVAPPKEGQQ